MNFECLGNILLGIKDVDVTINPWYLKQDLYNYQGNLRTFSQWKETFDINRSLSLLDGKFPSNMLVEADNFSPYELIKISQNINLNCISDFALSDMFVIAYRVFSKTNFSLYFSFDRNLYIGDIFKDTRNAFLVDRLGQKFTVFRQYSSLYPCEFEKIILDRGEIVFDNLFLLYGKSCYKYLDSEFHIQYI